MSPIIRNLRDIAPEAFIVSSLEFQMEKDVDGENNREKT